ncbi:MAG: hypothetical protein VB089_14515 [Anaerolineaceae bacterium]|nr:hypothetical protein [Anaerolineaceae bacterium]
MSRRVLLSILTLLLVACVVVSLISIGGVLTLVQHAQDSVQLLPTLAPAQGGLGSGLVSSDPAAAGLDGLDPSTGEQMNLIQARVAEIRGLQPVRSVPRSLLTRQELEQHVLDDFLSDYTPQEALENAITWNAFGLLPADFDLYNLYQAVLGEQVAGFYDSRTQQMYVVSDAGFDGLARMTYAHEYTHALQDQYYHLLDGLKVDDEHCAQETEYCAAVQALIEGDATLTELFWTYRYSTPQDQQELLDFYQDFESPAFDSAPVAIQSDFLFPYQQGLEFVQSLFDRGGWATVNQAFAAPPVSTEQILHPDSYPLDQPVQVELPDLQPVLGEDWVQLDRSVLGEWYSYLVLSSGWQPDARLSESEAKQAAAGWGGDAYQVFWQPHSGEVVLVQRWLWDTTADLDEFWQAMTRYGSLRWGPTTASQEGMLRWENTPNGQVILLRTGEEALWVQAPNAAVLSAVLESMQPVAP